MTDRDLQRAAERFADTVHEDVTVSVRQAWALERDRLYEEIAELRDEVHALGKLLAYVRHEDDVCDRHSVRVEPLDHATTPVERGRYTE